MDIHLEVSGLIVRLQEIDMRLVFLNSGGNYHKIKLK